jgi:hypothetical protein
MDYGGHSLSLTSFLTSLIGLNMNFRLENFRLENFRLSLYCKFLALRLSKNEIFCAFTMKKFPSLWGIMH